MVFSSHMSSPQLDYAPPASRRRRRLLAISLLAAATILASAFYQRRAAFSEWYTLTRARRAARAHGISGVLYVVESLFLLAAGITFLAAPAKSGPVPPPSDASVTSPPAASPRL